MSCKLKSAIKAPFVSLSSIAALSSEQREAAFYILEEYSLDGLTSWMFADSFSERL
ncbi:MAG: hypothetical protein ACJAY7_000655 [Pseudohongiellaceae bacterium]|jgi:hypothetical protein